MRSRIVTGVHCLAVATAIAALAAGCRVNTSDVKANFETDCNELGQGGDAVQAANIDGNIKAYVSAAADLKLLGDSIRGDVKGACINIATDLGEADRCSADNSDDAISNGGKTGACDVASARIEAILTAGATTSVNFALGVTGGQCEIAVETQLQCEETCKTEKAEAKRHSPLDHGVDFMIPLGPHPSGARRPRSPRRAATLIPVPELTATAAGWPTLFAM